MPRFTGAKRPGGVQRLRNVEELMANRQALSHESPAEVTAWMMLKMIHGNPWIFPMDLGFSKMATAKQLSKHGSPGLALLFAAVKHSF